jgi:hypothetical protein
MYAGGSEDQRILADWMLRLKAEKASGGGSAS